jgi:crotonobetainyl-CoA:carnitine CoA-transferase CaiB-like acyl-CoA transferase
MGREEMTLPENGRKPLLPEEFGPLQGIRILSTGTLIAQPYAAHLAATMGAEVVQVERPGIGDEYRYLGIRLKGPGGREVGTSWVQERRNAFYITLNLASPKGRDLFLRLIPHFDIWMESSPAGTYARWGITDEVVLQTNPKMVIVHVSGYGQTGHPDYVSRPSYDMIAQAFGGLMYLTGFPDPEPPVRAVPWTGDYITALFCLWSALAGYIYAQRTGKGQVIDVAQFECIHHTLAGTMVDWLQAGVVRERSGNRATAFQPYDTFMAKDGWVVVCAFNEAMFERVCRVIGLDPTEEKWRRARTDIFSPEGEEFDAILRGWINERTVKEVVEIFNAADVACSPVMSSRDMAEDPHYKARQVHIEWEDGHVGKVKGFGVTPRFSLTPGKIWRGSVPVGYDNELVYGHLLGLSLEEIAGLRSQGVL